jgi:endonuclease-3
MARRESRQARAARTETIFERLAAANPTPKGELQYINPFTLLVAVVLSAQATDAGVNKATPALFAIANTPEKMAALGVEQVTDLIKSIGLYRTKAKNVIALSRAIVERHGGETPRNREELEALPGVGRKTANVVLNTVFGEPTLAVDTHVFRVANRLNIAPGKTPREVEDGLMRVVPDRFLPHAHHWLILHGRYVCIARKPLCGVCVLVDLCPYEPKNLTGENAAAQVVRVRKSGMTGGPAGG